MLPVAESWYKIHTAGPGISRILESHVAPWMRCNMWLVHGRDRDLLIDSGMGLKPLKVEIAALRERPVTAICSHCHFDHMGCSYEFDTRLGHRSEAAIHALPDLDSTCARAWIAGELLTAIPHEGYSLSNYRITPAPLTGYLDEGDVIDTGDRVFNVFHLPGHSPGSITLYEEATRTLFSGDVIYDGQLIDNAWHSDPEAYRESLMRLRELPIETVHAGHEPSFGRDRLLQLIDQYLDGGMRIADVGSFLAARQA
jgi:glyoxylase-like metal-dependent hydrolase (beta-lactamase superfamily II)